MDDFGLTTDELLLLDGLSHDSGASDAVRSILRKLERLGMMTHDWPLALAPCTTEVLDFDPTGVKP